VWAIILILSVEVAQAVIQSDEDLGRLITGTWVPSQGDRTSPPAKTTYRSDGTMEFSAFSDKACTQEIMHIDGTWKIEKGRLTATVVRSSVPQHLPPGTNAIDDILSLSKHELVLLSDSKVLQRRTRSNVCIDETHT
jgi:hypothetical protein